MTQVQAAVSAALQQLGFVPKPSNGPPGSPSLFAVTHETIQSIRHIEGRDFEVDGAGNVKK